MSQTIQIEYSSERHAALIERLQGGAKPMELVSEFKMSADTIRRIRRTAAQFERFEIFLADGMTNVPVASVVTAKGFEHACRHVMRHFSGTFSNLTLPQWKLVAGANSVMVKDLREEMAA